jgi:hypothetical protein
VVVKVNKNAKNDDGNDNEPLKHVSQQNKGAGYSQQQYPAYVYGAQLIVMQVYVI